MNNGTHCYTQPGFISLKYSYHMQKGPEVTNKALNLRTLKVITKVINMKNHF